MWEVGNLLEIGKQEQEIGTQRLCQRCIVGSVGG